MKFIITFLVTALFAAASAEAKPLKIFILASQSNMEGSASIDTFDYIGDDPAATPIRTIQPTNNGDPGSIENDRARWSPDGKSIVYIEPDVSARNGQPWCPAIRPIAPFGKRDTNASAGRYRLGGHELAGAARLFNHVVTLDDSVRYDGTNCEAAALD